MFCSHVSDEKGIQALEILENKGYQTKILQDGEFAPQTAVAIFSLPDVPHPIPGRYLRIAAHRLLSLRPDWAVHTPFLAAINGNNKKWDSDKFTEAVLDLAKIYKVWFCSGSQGLPWNGFPSSKEKLGDLDRWRKEANCVLSRKPLWELASFLQFTPSRKESIRQRNLRQPPLGSDR